MAKKRTQAKGKKAPVKSTAVAIRKDTTLSLENRDQVNAFGKELRQFIESNNLSIVIAGNQYCMVDGWKFAARSFGLLAIPSKPVAKHEKGVYVTSMYAMREFLTKPKDGKQPKKYKKEVVVFAGFSSDVKVLEEQRKRNNPTREMTKPYFAYECDCEVRTVATDKLVSRGTALCSNIEPLKASFDEYSISSMSETRAIGKAIRNLLGYVMKAAGHESTPAEEMSTGMENGNPVDIDHEDVSDELEGFANDEEKEKVQARVRSGEWTVAHVKSFKKLTATEEEALMVLEKKAQKK